MSLAVPLSNPDITDLERQAVLEVLSSNRLSIGPHTEAFEAAIAARAGRKHGIAVNSGTSGLHLCVKALGLHEGDEVEIQVADERLFGVARKPGRQALIERLRAFRGRLPADFKFERDDANAR